MTDQNEHDEAENLPTPVTQEPPKDTYEVRDDDNLKEVFESGFHLVTSSAWPTPEARIQAYRAGYKLNGNKTSPGWTATR